VARDDHPVSAAIRNRRTYLAGEADSTALLFRLRDYRTKYQFRSTKTTKAATESRRIATDKVEWALGRLAALRRTELTDEDARIFLGWYAPVMIWEDGGLVVKPMRYKCRLAGKPVNYDFSSPAPTTPAATALRDAGIVSLASRTA
jgi:hypothetical protein